MRHGNVFGTEDEKSPNRPWAELGPLGPVPQRGCEAYGYVAIVQEQRRALHRQMSMRRSGRGSCEGVGFLGAGFGQVEPLTYNLSQSSGRRALTFQMKRRATKLALLHFGNAHAVKPFAAEFGRYAALTQVRFSYESAAALDLHMTSPN